MVSIEDARRRANGARIPPHNIEAEESLLGAMMLSREAITAAVEARLEPSDFYKPAHGAIFEAAYGLHSRGEPEPAPVRIHSSRQNREHVAGDAEESEPRRFMELQAARTNAPRNRVELRQRLVECFPSNREMFPAELAPQSKSQSSSME